MIVAFDFGITNTDIILKDDEIKYFTTPSVFNTEEQNFTPSNHDVMRMLESFNINLEEIDTIGVTGGKSADLPDTINNIPVIKVNEIEAIGKGARSLYDLDKGSALVVSAGTGTACIHLNEGIASYLGGISVGGGMLEGLSNLILNNQNGREINALAKNGNRKSLDLMIGDVVNEIGKLNAEITAANFAKARLNSSGDPEDISAAMCNMVGEVIGTVAYLNALLIGSDKAYFLGRTSLLSEVKKGIDARLTLAGVTGIYDDNRGLGNAIGVLASLESS